MICCNDGCSCLHPQSLFHELFILVAPILIWAYLSDMILNIVFQWYLLLVGNTELLCGLLSFVLIEITILRCVFEKGISLLYSLDKTLIDFTVALDLSLEVIYEHCLLVKLLIESTLLLTTLDKALLDLDLRIGQWCWRRRLSGLLQLWIQMINLLLFLLLVVTKTVNLFWLGLVFFLELLNCAKAAS